VHLGFETYASRDIPTLAPQPERNGRSTIRRRERDGAHSRGPARVRHNPTSGVLHRLQFSRRHWIGEDSDVLIESERIRRLGNDVIKLHGPFYVGDRIADRFHGVGGRNPRTSRCGIAAAVGKRHGHPSLRRLGNREADRIEPFRRIECERPRRHRTAGIEDVHASDSDCRHGIQVGDYPLTRDVPVHPVPPCLRPRRRQW